MGFTSAQKFSAVLALCALLCSPAAGFDTYWHTQASKQVGQRFGFSEYATNIMQLGNFSPDFFGPVAEFASGHLSNEALSALNDSALRDKGTRNFAIFLHFDNLNGELDRNSKFDVIFTQLLQSTQKLLADFNSRHDLDESTRKVLVLVTLGASMHTVQDFYSHSDWIHNDFDETPVKLVTMLSGQTRAPTWFEVKARLGDPDKWPFHVKTGIYPPIPNAVNTHTHMNHDNSKLLYQELENPGQPIRSQAPYHQAGPMPAKENDAAAILRHQQLAVNTAVGASIEWLNKVEENPGAKTAIESAKTWDLKSDNSKLFHELEAGMLAQMALSCAAGKWDGQDPPLEEAGFCRNVLEKKINTVGSAASGVQGAVMRAAAALGLPFALKFTGKFWSIHSRYAILQHLADGIAAESGHYRFPSK